MQLSSASTSDLTGAVDSGSRRERVARKAALPAAIAAGGVLLFFCYLKQSLTVAPTSDGAANALQAWDMLHGNVLLHGWALSDVSFYTTELPEYVLVEWLRGLNIDVVNIAGALTYTALVVVAALLARGTARGRRGVLRMAVAVGIMLSPQLGPGVSVLILQSDHVGTTVPVLLAWAVVLVVLVLLCADAESRDYLLGHGKVLSVTSVGLLVLVLTMMMLGWAVTS